MNMDMGVVMLKKKILDEISCSPLPITVKGMIIREISNRIREKEEDEIDMILSVIGKGDGIDAVITGRSEEKTILRADETIQVGQQPISAGDVQSTEHS